MRRALACLLLSSFVPLAALAEDRHMSLTEVERAYSNPRVKPLEPRPARNNFALFEDLAKQRALTLPTVEDEKDKASFERSFQYVRFLDMSAKRTFNMGSPETESGHTDHEFQRSVTLKRPFEERAEMGATPVTQLQWFLVMGDNPAFYKDSDPRQGGMEYGGISVNALMPIESVSWDRAQEFLAKINAQDTNWVYRLPTEAEWEFAVRAGTTTRYFFGDNFRAEHLKYFWRGGSFGRVGAMAPNPFGLYDMQGLVYQWVQDFYVNHPSGGVDPQGPPRFIDHAYRGANWRCETRNQFRSAYRPGCQPPEKAFDDIGFRLVRSPRPKG